MGRPKKYSITLSEEELQLLKSIIRKEGTSRTIRRRCQVLIDIDEAHGKVLTHEQSARSNGICMVTVGKTVKEYCEGGLDKVLTYNRNSNSDQARRKLDGRSEAKLIEIACGPAPEGHSRWTLRLLEEKCRVELDIPVSKDTIGRALKKTNYDLTATTTGASHRRKTQNS
ncbi:MAG: helix-turn-helix domain-containing protein [Oscillospiraceae bacterium]|jgi:transposase|nr:helix-turn-helix domain-containing protein [Oscillospiraceae bacterium]